MKMKNKLSIMVMMLVVVSLAVVPSINAFALRGAPVVRGISTEVIVSGESIEIPDSQETKASIGTFWWYRGDGGLMYAEGDAEGFAQAMQEDGCQWELNINDVNGVEDLQDDHLEETSSELIDDVDLAYFVAHSGPAQLGIYKPFPNDAPLFNDPEYAEAKYCKWGNDGPLKWVVLATCLAAAGGYGLTNEKDFIGGLLTTGFQSALQGINMILGWKTGCDDALYGPTFASKILEGKTLRQAWFETAEEREHVHGIAKILGEDESVADDHLKGYGTYATPEVDDTFCWWEHEVAGWGMLEAWIAPSSHTDNSWQQEGKAYDNVDPDYTVIDELTGYPNYPETQAIFDEENDSGWTDPLTLGLGYSITIKGFRIIANKPKTYDNQTHDEIPGYDYMELKFYNGDAWKTTVTITNWEGGSWRIIDFQDLFYATLVGDDEPLVNRVEIRIHENMSTKSFDDHPAKISEFDFWFVSGPTGEGEVESLPLAPLAFNEVGFSTIANNLGMSGVTEYVNTETLPQTTKLEDGEELLTYSEETGMLEYIKPSQAYPIAASEPALPSDAGAISMALTMLVNNGLPAEEFTLKTITYDTQGAGDKYTDEVFYNWITTKTVYFERQIGGVTLPELTKVTIGLDGTIAAFSIPLLDLA